MKSGKNLHLLVKQIVLFRAFRTLLYQLTLQFQKETFQRDVPTVQG